MRPGALLLPWSKTMGGFERVYQIDQLLNGRKFVTRTELLDRLDVSYPPGKECLISMGKLARALQQRFRASCAAGWRCTFEQPIMTAALERTLGFAPRADVLLTRDDGSGQWWIEFEVSRADPVANHA